MSSQSREQRSKPRERQRKLIAIDNELLSALAEYSRETGVRFDDAFEEALRDYLQKHGQPVGLHEALKQSAKMIAANDRIKIAKSKRKRR
jgi:hypothetical protein